jgi:microcystin-dependent protein
MANPFVGEIRLFAFPSNYVPNGWAQCNGQSLSVSQNSALFALLGTMYGGDGVNTFNLPDLRSRVPVHQGQGTGLSSYALGEETGAESVTLTLNQIPAHSHSVNATTNTGGNVASPQGAYLAVPSAVPRGTTVAPYSTATPANVTLAAATISAAGGGQPVSVIQPVLCLNFCIALVGVYPVSG